MSGWQYKNKDGEVVGILSDDEMKHCAGRGGFSLDSLVKHDEKTNGKWVAAQRIKPLRTRLEAIETEVQEQQASEPAVMSGYMPPSPKKATASRVTSLLKGGQGVAASPLQSAAGIVHRLTAKKPLHVCLKCEGEFAKYEILGKCPLCGEWAIVACESCGLESGAKRFVENDCKCPRCAAKVSI